LGETSKLDNSEFEVAQRVDDLIREDTRLWSDRACLSKEDIWTLYGSLCFEFVVRFLHIIFKARPTPAAVLGSGVAVKLSQGCTARVIKYLSLRRETTIDAFKHGRGKPIGAECYRASYHARYMWTNRVYTRRPGSRSPPNHARRYSTATPTYAGKTVTPGRTW
jgi:hypothetical protein